MSGDRANLKVEAPVNSPAEAGAEPPGAGVSVSPNVTDSHQAATESVERSSPRHLWQMPSILASVVLIAWGMYVGARPNSALDLVVLLDAVEQSLAAAQVEQAGLLLRTVPEASVDDAPTPLHGRFRATLADYLYAAATDEPNNKAAGYQRVADQYQRAGDLHWKLSPAQQERWAVALMNAGDLDGARARLIEMDRVRGALTETENAAEYAAIRNRLFRKIVDRTLGSLDRTADDLMNLVTEYRLDRTISTSDEIWAIARQTELRYRAQQTRHGIDMLMVEMRRLEHRDLSALPGGIGELYSLLGRGYFELGDYDRASGHLEHALTLLPPEDAVRGTTLALLGQLELAMGEVEVALERFQAVTRDFIATPAYAHGLLGSAEAYSMLSQHAEALVNFRELCRQINEHAETFGITSTSVAASLCDRHDAALALGHLETALAYIGLAESLFVPERVPAEVLIRQAATNRQCGDDLLTRGEAEAPPFSIVQVDRGLRREANYRYETAGEYYLRHFNADAAASPGMRDGVADSLWLAADCFDFAGRHHLAIANFLKYLDMQPIDDPRRPETLFRLGQAYQATTDHENAAQHFEQVVADRSRSTFAARSYVPLARSYVALNRTTEARQLLLQVTSGSRLLMPDATDYRSALLELGRIEYHAESYMSAIKALAEFVERYPDDYRILEVRYLLADSYRSNAMGIMAGLSQDAALSPSESGRLNAAAVEQLQTALDLFGAASDADIPTGTDAGSEYLRDVIRRATFYRADCAFHLRQLALAVELYDRAARRYSAHPSSMYALIQIVNSYNALGDTERAAAAHHRALVRLKQLDDDAFAAPDALMDRAAWERWLQSVPVGPSLRLATPATNG